MRPRLMSESDIALLHANIANGRELASIAVLAKRFSVSPRTMSRYLATASLRAYICPKCQGSGYVRGKKESGERTDD